ncbi:MAG: hypothetical protein IJH20_01310 [Bacilli bacterium]|nr:hypothetical protein [Bacilli bacterium]
MKKKLKFIILGITIIGLLITAFALNIGSVNAEDETITGYLYHNTKISQIKYGHRDPKGWTPVFSVTNVPNDLGTNNAFCLDPNEKAPGNQTITGHTESYNNDGDLIKWNETRHKYFLYFLYGGPGWEENKDTIIGLFKSNNIMTDSETESDNQLYAYSHALIALAYHGRGYQGDRGLTAAQLDGLQVMQNQLSEHYAENGLVLDKKKFANFKVYYTSNDTSSTNYQDIIFWTYEEPKVYIDVVKAYEDSADDDGEERIFKLYKANNGKCEDLHDASHLVAASNNANTGYHSGSHYYLGLKRTGSGSNVEYEALLDPKGKYCIWEKPAKKTGTDTYYTVEYNVTTTTDTENESNACPSSDPDLNGKCVYGVINLGSQSGYKYDSTVEVYYKRVTATNDIENNGCISITKTDGQGNNLEGVTFNLYEDDGDDDSTNNCSGTVLQTKQTNASGIAKFSGLNNGTKYYAKESWSGAESTKYKIDGTCREIVTGSTSTCKKVTVTNSPYYISFYKENEKGEPLSDIKFKVQATGSSNYVRVYSTPDDDGCYIYRDETTSGSTLKTDSNGRICIVQIPKINNDTSYKAKELRSLDGYAFENGQITGIKPQTSIKGKTCTSSSDCNKLINTPLVMNFYKVLEDGETPKGGAEFIASYVGENDTTQYIKVKSEKENENGNKGCYIYDGETTNKSEASKLVSSTTDESNGVNIGEVCIVKLPAETYKVTETKPLDYHTFGEETTKTFIVNDSSKSRKSFNDAEKYKNYKTEFEFTKTVSEENGLDDIWKTMSTEELKKIPFTIYDSNGNAVSVIKTSDGVYEYAGNNIDGVTGTPTTTLNLNSSRKIYVYHLPVGKYTIKENDCCCEDTCTSPSSNICYGFYSPKYGNNTNSYSFTIDKCSTSQSTGKDELGNNVCEITTVATQTLDNRPTEVEFTKKDFYGNVIPNEEVKFENEEEISAFDGITFKVYYRGQNNEKVYVDFAKVGDVGTCKTEESYSEYRYIPEGTDSSLISDLTITQELHTCGGHIHLTHLCRGRKYYIEEVAVTGKSVFILPETEEERTREIDLSCCDDQDQPKPSTTVEILDKPSRVTFEKRDSKYGYLIDDETTTFEVYRCPEGQECHPGDYVNAAERQAAGMTLIKFNQRGIITGDEEDPNVEVYRAILNIEKETDNVTDLHPYHGKLVFRYLQGGYNYVLLETVAPKGYRLPKGRNAESSFTVSTETVQVDEIDVPNKPTSLLIRKYDDSGNLLEGAEFRIYEGTTCDKNLSPMAQPKELLKLKTIRDGVYDNREIRDTDKVITCTDKENDKCSDIDTSLTYSEYVDTWANFDNSVNQNNEKVEIKAGEILIQYLDYGHCYIIEEVKAPKGYSLPEKEEDRFIMVTIEKESEIVDTLKELVNKPTPFTFYKYDDYNNLIDGGEYKLQKLNQNKKYEDLTVTEEVSGDKIFYKVDKNSTNKVIKTKNGSATVYYLEEGQYIIIETKAPNGMELPKKELNVAVFYVSEDGSVVGNSIIANKPKTEKIVKKPSASAELIVTISTGMEKIKYGLIFIGIIAILGVLIIIRYKPQIFKNK